MGLGRLPWFERATLVASALTLGVALTSWALMRLGAYSLGRTLGLTLVLAVGVTALGWRLPPLDVNAPALSSRVSALALGLCLGFGILYALFPTYFLLGGQD